MGDEGDASKVDACVWRNWNDLIVVDTGLDWIFRVINYNYFARSLEKGGFLYR